MSIRSGGWCKAAAVAWAMAGIIAGWPAAVLSAPRPVVPAASGAPAADPLPVAVTPSALPQRVEPADRPYPGLITLTVDATDLDHHVFHAAEAIPLAPGAASSGSPGEVVLLLPRWLPGNHGPTGPVSGVAGLIFRSDGRQLSWTRDPVDSHAFHVQIPAGTRMVEVEFDLVTATGARGEMRADPRDGRVVMSPAIVDLQWSGLVLYPAGYFSRGINVAARVVLPGGWKAATALEREATAAADPAGGQNIITFRPVDLETLVDSPLIAGAHQASFDLDPSGSAPVRLNLFGDKPDALVMRPDQLAAHRNLVREAYRLFGGRPFDRYDFLVTVSDQISPIGLEHARSSENGVSLRYLTDWEKLASERDLLPHEFVHSWNGKSRRPAGLYTATFDTPMRDELLWVYEGQTQYWGRVLAARAGLVSRQQALDMLAEDAAAMSARVGRRWRPLQDTTQEPVIGGRSQKIWPSWQRGADYYVEGALLWLDVDTLIREQTRGQRSLDDFARTFFGPRPGDTAGDAAASGSGNAAGNALGNALGNGAGSWALRTYGLDDVVRGLNAVTPYDWAGFLRERLQRFGAGAPAPLEGLARAGYRLVYADAPSDSFRLDEARRRGCDLTYSLGLSVDAGGVVRDVVWDGPAYQAGLAPGALLVALNGMAFDPEGLKDAVRAAHREAAPPLELIVRTGDNFRIVRIPYRGGLRYPRLERDPTAPARLDDILSPHARRSDGGGAGGL